MTVAQKWVAGTVVAALVLLAGGWYLLVAPQRSEAADIETEAEAQLSTNAGLQTQVDVLKVEAKSLPEEQARLAELQAQVPQATNMPSIVRQLNDAADKAGVDFVSITPSAAVPVGAAATVPGATGSESTAPGSTEQATPTTPVVPGSNGLLAVDSAVEVVGGYFEVMRFVNELEGMQRYMLVTEITTGQDDGPEAGGSETDTSSDATALRSTLTVRVFALPEAGTLVPTETAPTTGTGSSDDAAPAA
jgi:Tfp pilus assembly protein PilO